MRIQVRRSQKQLNVQNIGMRRLVAILILCASVTAIMASGHGQGSQQAQPQAQPSPSPRPAITQVPPEEAARELNNPRSKWFREAKFGLFIHWGLYAIPAGTWKDKQIPGLGEWIMNRAKIPVKEYERLAKEFNPVKFNADEWAQFAQDAGVKYLTITSKHHDGFAMFRSMVSGYNVENGTPFKRDVIKELAAACAKHGIKFCVYYSQAQDWHEPNGAGNTWDFGPDDKKDFDQYLRDKAVPQVRELLTQYGPIGLIWFDTPRLMNEARASQFTNLVRELQPDTLLNGRLGGKGDYRSTGDNRIPNEVVPGIWEVPATINDTWGFKSYDHNWKSVEDITFKLVDIVSKGGNYLLNVGPTAEGVIPEESVVRLRAVGAWLKANGQSIYGTSPTAFGAELKGKDWRCTTKRGKYFIHLFQWPNGTFELDGVKSKIKKSYLLVDSKNKLKVNQSGDKVSITLPARAPDTVDSVLVLEY
jgi:alpha-L-fucosidase